MAFTTGKDIAHRFAYHPPKNPETIKAHEQVRGSCFDLALHFAQTLPEGREKAVAITKIEEAMFWANAAIARAE